MYKITTAFLLSTIFSFATLAQGTWTWVAGTGESADYGTMGVGAASNQPQNNNLGLYAGAEWTDKKGNFWWYSGGGPTGARDMWTYDFATGHFIWMNGVGASAPVFNTAKGVPSTANSPGSRLSRTSWSDPTGDFLWLNGGSGSNTMWRYTIATGEWTWISGGNVNNSPAVIGIIGIPDTNNTPGAFFENNMAWVDKYGMLWLANGSGLNALWQFNPNTNEWAVIRVPGAINTGTIGQESATNSPGGGSRFCWVAWYDSTNNHLWHYGNNINGSDLWRYNIITNNWTCFGMGYGNDSTKKGIPCVADANNWPAARSEAQTNWYDGCGNLWMFGGLYNGVIRNELWRYSVKTHLWTMVHDNHPHHYGDIGVPSYNNYPDSSYGQPHFYRDNAFWMLDYGRLWRYDADKPTASMIVSDTFGLAPMLVTFTNTSTPGCNEMKSFLWHFGDPGSGSLDTSSSNTPSHNYTNTGLYSVKLVVTNCTGSKDSITKIIKVTKMPIASIANDTLCVGECIDLQSVTVSGFGIATYHWSPNIGYGSSLQQVCPTVTTNYTLVVTDVDSLKATTTAIVTVVPSPELTFTTTPANCNKNDGSAIISATGGRPPYAYDWVPGGQTTNSLNALFADNYSVTVTDANGCNNEVHIDLPSKDSSCCEPKSILVPNIFSPNGDGKNDLFYATIYNEACSSAEFQIYNRWGLLIYQSDEKMQWDGITNGEPLPSGVYFYVLIARKEGEAIFVKNGTILITR